MARYRNNLRTDRKRDSETVKIKRFFFFVVFISPKEPSQLDAGH